MLPVHVHVLAMCVATILEICSLGPHSSMQPAYRPISQTPQSKCLIPHNTPFRTELCTFRFFIAHCWIWTNALWYLCNWSLGHFRLKIYVILLACVSSDSPNWQRKMCNWALVSNICNDSWNSVLISDVCFVTEDISASHAGTAHWRWCILWPQSSIGASIVT